MLAKIGCQVWKLQNSKIAKHPKEAKPSGLPKKWDLILLHAPGTDADSFSEKQIVGPVLHYSGDGGGGTNTKVPRPVNHNSELSERELRLFTKFFFSNSSATIESSIGHVWSTAPVLALRILCEAWEFVEGKKAAGDLSVRAPRTPTDWFNPFGKPTPGSGDAVEIAKLMGEVQVEAELLLMAVLKGKGIKRPIHAFLAAVRQSKQTA